MKKRSKPSSRGKGTLKSRKPAERGRERARVEVTGAPNLDFDLPWAVSGQRLRYLTGEELKDLMQELLLAETYECKGDVSQVWVNSEEKAADGGSDGWTPAVPEPGTWLRPYPICWQFKAGVAGGPAKLKGEVRKPEPRRALSSGGGFTLVASASPRGKPGHDERLRALQQSAKRAGLPTANIRVVSSETLATWLNEHPAICARIHGVHGFLTLDRWQEDGEHQGDWMPSPKQACAIESVRKALDFDAGTTPHVHIAGHPGVGKTRLALEACRGAPWARRVLYVPQASDPVAFRLLHSVADSASRTLVLVVDEVRQADIRALSQAAYRAPERIRLITIGHGTSPDLDRIVQVNAQPLDEQTIKKIVEKHRPGMPREHVDYVVRLADGFVRLALLAANAISKNPSLDTASFLRRSDIKLMMDGMLGTADRRSLHVVALLASVGWEGDREQEGMAIARHLGLEWSKVRVEVQRFHSEYQIAPPGGRLRYITPEPLGVSLMLEALEADPGRVRSLPEALPTEQARRAFYERLSSLVGTPAAKPMAEEELARFSCWEHFLPATDVARWAVLAPSSPESAARAARIALAGATHDERAKITGASRRDLVSTLSELAWHSGAFLDAAGALAHLAAAENESWENDATGEFLVKFQVCLGGTAYPYPDRLQLLRELLSSGDPRYQRLAVPALARMADLYHESRGDPGNRTGKPRPPEWQPQHGKEHVDCVLAALNLLGQAISLPCPEVDAALLEAGKEIVQLLRFPPTREEVAALLRSLAQSRPHFRDPIRAAVRYELQRSRRLKGEEASKGDPEWLESFHRELADQTLGGRLRQAVGQSPWEEGLEPMAPIAAAFVGDVAALRAEWGWLTSGEAHRAWDFGDALAVADPPGDLLSVLVHLPGRGPDLRAIAGYVNGRGKSQPDGWVDDFLDAHEQTVGDDFLLFDLTHRCAPTSRGARRIARLIREKRIAVPALRQIEYGPWDLGPDLASFVELLESLVADEEARVVALSMMDHRLSDKPKEWEKLEAVALSLLEDGGLLRQGDMATHYWTKIAKRVGKSHARTLARTLFVTHGTRGRHTWFLEHGHVDGTLNGCIEADPMGTWEELRVHLEDRQRAVLFTTGFPDGVVDRLPRQEVLRWVGIDPATRARLLARIARKSFEDGSLACDLIDRYAREDEVDGAFFSAFVSGRWWGRASAHWESEAQVLDGVAKATSSQAVRRWASHWARTLRDMAEKDRRSEEEERLRPR